MPEVLYKIGFGMLKCSIFIYEVYLYVIFAEDRCKTVRTSSTQKFETQ
jgi:hypothetical protein